MVSNIDYSKYENMDKKRLMNALISTENKISKYKQEIENHLNLKKFLESKIKKSLTGNKAQIKAVLVQDSKILNSIKASISKTEKKQIEAELEKEINAEYTDEF
ncbi:hypothetical protein LS70_006810 [Helicobacter sp. MIT 11-5569]|uniref:hypothetical protein n=1 Tax=Helicobacter sp. MIT 11-5569 TaxID=1548151 RepID=UPI00051FA888|nr:hypothetical protein [Helicobacter sp. MIT 11-5569]TLD82672.1 hypothetical protein LS70_006810 [Helicobacter sp. MIT 11-5569]